MTISVDFLNKINLMKFTIVYHVTQYVQTSYLNSK